MKFDSSAFGGHSTSFVVLLCPKSQREGWLTGLGGGGGGGVVGCKVGKKVLSSFFFIILYILSHLISSRLCPSTAGCSPPSMSSIFVCLLPS